MKAAEIDLVNESPCIPPAGASRGTTNTGPLTGKISLFAESKCLSAIGLNRS